MKTPRYYAIVKKRWVRGKAGILVRGIIAPNKSVALKEYYKNHNGAYAIYRGPIEVLQDATRKA